MTDSRIYDVKTLWLPEDRSALDPGTVWESMDCMIDFLNSLSEPDKLMLHFLLLDRYARDKKAREEGGICD